MLYETNARMRFDMSEGSDAYREGWERTFGPETAERLVPVGPELSAMLDQLAGGKPKDGTVVAFGDEGRWQWLLGEAKRKGITLDPGLRARLAELRPGESVQIPGLGTLEFKDEEEVPAADEAELHALLGGSTH